jgi:hypothetical protein
MTAFSMTRQCQGRMLPHMLGIDKCLSRDIMWTSLQCHYLLLGHEVIHVSEATALERDGSAQNKESRLKT